MLPPSKDGQNFVTVSPILGGQITLPEQHFVHPADATAHHTVPSLSFLITHPGHGEGPRRVMFDLGLRSSITDYSEPQQRHLSNREPYTIGPGVAATLRQGGCDPLDIDTVILSHVHYDHHGDPEHFPNAQFIVGPGTTRLLEHGLESSASHQHFSKHLLPPERTVELPSLTEETGEYKWEPLGPFSSIDLLGDGSVFVLDSPGHLPGHINLLCRISSENWVCLCGDAYHDRRLLTGERDIAFWEGSDGAVCCIHNDPTSAARALRQLRELVSLGNVELIGAHDAGWFAANRHRMFPEVL
ncbi:Metallo-hydrolase/oxidoreductase [Coniochaeta ligniaria NRRL 30616]|uniref:Metallo-hydrolase/oxidoreductase n=1 Tax=Coniochaeta ligniaria NRRL 30616 TaxID=1408157 RepID=A0A1J7K412_9PEZI|nr:Metallo-hydrolase/oxidoreductase [Coniochaeta ligniaria NRRL 30616]